MAETVRNRNALRSQRLIREAFIKLARESKDGRITVSDLCKTADTNRTTFYAHYDSLEDLEAKLWQGYFEALEAWLADELGRGFLTDPLPGLNRLGAFIIDNIPLFQVFGIRKTEELMRDVEHEGGFGMAVREALLRAMGTLDADEIVRFDFVSSAMLNVYYTWLAGQYSEMTLDQLNERLALLVKSCFAP